MKAKEYAQVLIDAKYSPDAIFQFSKDLAKEISTIMKLRNCQSASAINSVFLEIDQKYRAVRRIVNKHENANVIKEDGFKELMYKLYADSPLRFELDFLKPKPEYVMGVDVASGPDFSGDKVYMTQKLHEKTEKRLLEGANPDSKPRGLMDGQQIPSTW